ncbi:hypothetical protein F442_11031, partial [Phytophthora nicotianae P10297]
IEYDYFKDHLAFLHASVDHIRAIVDVHISRHERMRSGETVSSETLDQYGSEGFKKEKNYNVTLILSMAMGLVSCMANNIELAQWMKCHCSKCSYYRSPAWMAKRSDEMTRTVLVPKQFYRRGRGKVCASDRLYNKPWKTYLY